MKRIFRAIFHNGQIKLACLAAATLIWLFVKHNVAQTVLVVPAASAPLPPEQAPH